MRVYQRAPATSEGLVTDTQLPDVAASQPGCGFCSPLPVLEFCTLQDCEEKGSRKRSACLQRAVRIGGGGVPVPTAQDVDPQRMLAL